jgi:CheY-like chemotaxis protein
MRVRFWGTRGSIATPGAGTLLFGGNTSCVEVVTDAGKRFIFDSGTGIRQLGLDLMKNASKPIRATILLGHTHWDHIQGLPFFVPVFVPGNEITIGAPKGVGRSLSDVLSGQMEYTYFPIELGQLPAKINYLDLVEGTHEIDGIRVTAQYLNHPATALGYRVHADGVSVMYLCDHEPYSETLWRADAEPGRIESILHTGDRRHAAFMSDADLVIHDAQYTPEEYAAKKNWGHSTFEYVVELAAAAGVRRVLLTHHDPLHDDAAVEQIQQRGREIATRRGSALQVSCAYEGWDVTVVGRDEPRSTSIAAQSTVTAMPLHLRILVVDDDPNLRLLVTATLTRDGHAVMEAGDGVQGLRVIEEAHPDLIILDYNMPNLDGVQVLQRLRSQTRTARVPVLMLTAQGDESSTRAGFDAGANDYLTKPFTMPQLSARVRACFARAASAT